MKRALATAVSLILVGGGLTACDWSSGGTDDCSMGMHQLPMRGGSGSSGYSGGGSRSSYGGSSSRSYGGGSYGGSRVSYGGRTYTSRYSSSYPRRSSGGVTYVYVGNAWVVDSGC